MEMTEIIEMAKGFGFTTVAELDVKTLQALPDIRKMCEMNTCGKYGVNWACPPGCGNIESCEVRMKKYSKGIIVQTVGDIEDSFDWEGIMEVNKAHDERYRRFSGAFLDLYPDSLPLADGTCTICEKCTYPDNPCRFPDKCMSSMEAFGLFVSDICKKNGIAYNYGEGKMCFTGCILFN